MYVFSDSFSYIISLYSFQKFNNPEIPNPDRAYPVHKPSESDLDVDTRDSLLWLTL